MKSCQYCGRTENDSRVIRTSKFGEEMLLCMAHYKQMIDKGELRHRRTDPNEFIEHDDFIEMFLYDKVGNKIASTYFSKQHKNAVLKYRWCVSKSGKLYTDYVLGNIDGKRVSLHSFIAKILFGERPKGLTVDHNDRNGLNNIDSNLSYEDQTSQNVNQKTRKDNSSGVKGVSYSKRDKKWKAQLKHKEVLKIAEFGRFEEAVEQRKVWEILRDKGELK
ncbi:HNH endonuclease [Bacillus phage PBC2]|uniref:HNH endonuclease n=1 Tax=Bacillus phage PBC2 TaxID=1675029 RepID=A0A218KC76_9CAUD|nr:HNH endonuclease [Bacillus phage PBC2]AKQ08494.1 hypothetical protein PBC2_179 [Bacillus phage PBC2]